MSHRLSLVVRAFVCCVTLGATLLLSARTAGAATISLVGDVDCFGLTGPCPDGTRWRDDLGGVFFNNYQDPGDPSFTDKWSSDVDPTYTHTYTLDGAPVSASLTVRTAGLADNRGPWNVFFNGLLIGAFATNTSANAFQEVITHSFVVPIALLTGSDVVLLAINSPTVTDGYSIDYSQLSVATVAAPEPAAIVLLGSGILGVALRRRRKLQAR